MRASQVDKHGRQTSMPPRPTADENAAPVFLADHSGSPDCRHRHEA